MVSYLIPSQTLRKIFYAPDPTRMRKKFREVGKGTREKKNLADFLVFSRIRLIFQSIVADR